VAVASEDKKADEVREKAGATNGEDKFGAGDLRWFDETSQGLEDDGYTEGDEEDGVEKST
jgi:hypothetical protein